MYVNGHLSYLQEQGAEIQEDITRASIQAQDNESFKSLKSASNELVQLLGESKSTGPGAPDKTILIET
jgi:hypothetical protein